MQSEEEKNLFHFFLFFLTNLWIRQKPYCLLFPGAEDLQPPLNLTQAANTQNVPKPGHPVSVPMCCYPALCISGQ